MKELDIVSVDALVVGSGAAGFSAACRLRKEGVASVAIVTEHVLAGTSRNTGSDKQTYYKLSLGGGSTDSVALMAENLFAGGSVDGDNALCEAALSVRCFMNLCELGVPFPVNRYGEYVGYKTDHDPYARATSAGPLTSKYMTEALEKEASRLQIPVYSGFYAVEILKDENGVCGLLCLEKKTGHFVAFHASDLVLATGGPAGIYADSVYPHCHTGSSSLAFRAGAAFQNMTEWQYGLASVQPRWNVSGTYMQVLPRFVSVDKDGTEREFLLDFFDDPYEALSLVFLKGYQWPFDSSKVLGGSSVIDLLVYREQVLGGRKVYLDYRSNPFGLQTVEFEKLSAEAYAYLQNAGACFGTPIQRLMHMNQPAVELYSGKGVDLGKQMLPIALCAQHNNGGISVDLWWQTTVPGLFAAGECAGTHGISRPGGSALNAGQVGALRAAQYIAAHRRMHSDPLAFREMAEQAVSEQMVFSEKVLSNRNNADTCIQTARDRMSTCGAAIRHAGAMEKALAETQAALKEIEDCVGVADQQTLYKAYQYRDTLVCQIVCLSAMLDYSSSVGSTRGSSLYTNHKGQKREGLDEIFRFACLPRERADQIQQGVFSGDACSIFWRPVRPIPDCDDCFENVWRGYRSNQNIF
ncbi:MAG: FAD-binding protein [Oscillospiraceae bacterium]|nr:FAD-binding protein [Oscillospiraceae bacterium]